MPSFTLLLRVSLCLSGEKNVKLFNFRSLQGFICVYL